MARATYLAPGVYVEEVPSAQQPIAGVGTNTVGFIGFVPNEVKYPVPNPDYDPVHAKLALKIAALKAQGATVSDADTKSIDKEIADLQKEIDRLTADVSTNQNTLNDLRRQLEDVERIAQKPEDQRTPEETQALSKRQSLTARITRLDTEINAKNDKIRLNTQSINELKQAKEGKTPLPTVGQSSVLRPYLLETFKLDVAPCATKLCTNFSEYAQQFGNFSADTPEKQGEALHPGHRALTHAVSGFFKNGGTRCFVARVNANSAEDANADEIDRTLTAFESIDEVAIIAAPGLCGPDIWDKLVTHCETCENRFAILDSPEVVETDNQLDITLLSYSNLENVLPQRNKNAALYFPYIEVVDPAVQLQDEDPARGVDLKYRGRVHVPPSGHIAGIYARTDEERGVHKAPANTAVLGALNVKYYIGKPKQELLNPQGVNCIRNINGNITVWGARTIGGDVNGEWKYINVRRTFLFLRKSIDEGTQWCVFEPNDPQLWGKIRRNVGAFLTNVWRSGALFGLTPEEAFYVKCDAETNPPEVRDLGMVVTEIGVAIVRPAEFVIFRITQSTGPKTS